MSADMLSALARAQGDLATVDRDLRRQQVVGGQQPGRPAQLALHVSIARHILVAQAAITAAREGLEVLNAPPIRLPRLP
jgi:hypothetical protein